MKSQWIALAALAVCGTLAAETVKMPDGSYADTKFVRNYFAPQPDFVPEFPIGYYTRNTRTPEIVWVKHNGSYGPGLRIRPIDEKWLKKEIEFKLIAPQHAKAALEFKEEREKDERNRKVTVGEINEETDFTAFTFKMKTDVKNAGADVKIEADGVGTFETAKCPDVKDEADGVKSYTFPLKPINARLSKISIVVAPITGKIEDAKQDITIFDMHFKRAKAHAFISETEPRRFIDTKTGADVADVFDWIAKNPADSRLLPVAGWAVNDPEKDKDTKIETVKEKIDGREVDALRITWTKGKLRSYVKLPFPANALDENTFSFLYKLETPSGKDVEHCEGRELSRIPQYFLFDKYIDNPGVSFYSKEDRYDWNVPGVTRSHLSQGRRTGSAIPAGWKGFAFDMINDDPTGNKGFTYDKISGYGFTFKNDLIPDGAKVVLTVALPKITRGLLYTGGDMKQYAAFKEWKKNYKPLDYEEALKQQTPYDSGKLAQPLEVMKDGIIDLEIINCTVDSGIPDSRKNAAETLQFWLTRVLNPKNEIPILRNQPSKRDNVKIFLTEWGADGKTRAELTKMFQDREAIGNTPGSAVRTVGKNIYIMGGRFGRLGEDKGVMNGVLDFLEYNLGLIWARPIDAKKDDVLTEAVFTPVTDGNFSFTWGNRRNIPEMKWWGFSNGNSRYSYLNRASYFGCWIEPEAFDFASYRVSAANHWFGFGAMDESKRVKDKWDETFWGTNKDGKKYMPGCYTGSPCLVKVIDAGKDDFLNTKFRSQFFNRTAPIYYEFNNDSNACWIEDTWNTCQCPECLTPVRLPDGTTIGPEDPDFKAESHMVNATAYNQMTRVYANRDMQLNYLIYFFTIPVPRLPLTKYVRAHFCPYVRADYYEPIYAPVNDKFWRLIHRWGQAARVFGISDYYLGGHFRPLADIQKMDIAAMKKENVVWFGQETENLDGSVMETWVANRLFWEPSWSPDALRAYYCQRTFGEGGKDVYDFYAKLRALKYAENRAVDFEDWAELGFLARKTPPTKAKGLFKTYANLAEELSGDLERAEAAVKDPVRKLYIQRIRTAWAKYLEDAQKIAE